MLQLETSKKPASKKDLPLIVSPFYMLPKGSPFSSETQSDPINVEKNSKVFVIYRSRLDSKEKIMRL